MRTMLKSKIHRATVTQANADLEGSITIDVDLMEAASILPFEQVHVNNLTNGVRLQTYVVEGSRGSGTICINGAAAKHVSKDDLVIILAYDQVAEPEAHGWRPTLVYVDDKNQITRVAQHIQAEKR
jgi:aspartate 1-decarboxylase